MLNYDQTQPNNKQKYSYDQTQPNKKIKKKKKVNEFILFKEKKEDGLMSASLINTLFSKIMI